jgi:two-component system cell cycle response regulator
MTARILIVDDIPANLKLLEARLTAEYFDVLTASNGPEALALLNKEPVDIVLLDVMMPGMDGFEVCRQIKTNPARAHIPVVLVTALDQSSDRVKGLEAGADDFLTKPVNDLALVTRVRSLVRLKIVLDELRMRAATSREIGVIDSMGDVLREQGRDGRVLVVDQGSAAERIVSGLAGKHHVDVETDPQEALFKAAEGKYDLVMISNVLNNFDPLRLCSQLRSVERTRHLPILLITETGAEAQLLRALDIGVNDYLLRPIDKGEMAARIATQVRKKRYSDHLRSNVQQSLELAITDSLTGLHNRRYLETHLQTLYEQASSRGKPLSVLVLDIDFFKAVNDTHGHDAGDEVLKEFANRMRKNVRGIDLVCRLGGEEFVVVMPDTDLTVASIVGERVRQTVASERFSVQKGSKALDVTVSIGLSAYHPSMTGPEDLLKKADEALYRAKREGRNRLVVDAA